MNTRTNFVVAVLAVLYVFSWLFSLAPLIFGKHFWNREYALEQYTKELHDPTLYNATAFHDVGSSYYSERRYMYLLPHVLGAIVWWNLYFLQLIPSIRHWKNKKFHRILGRVLMLAALCQVVSGIGLAMTSHSHIITMVSGVLAAAVVYCMWYAYYYAYHRDIARHKQWVLRMVGYLQTIALQRFWIVGILTCHGVGWDLWYQAASITTLEEANTLVLQMFDDSFLLAVFTAFLGTEWYLAGENGWTEAAGSALSDSSGAPPSTVVGENKPLLA